MKKVLLLASMSSVHERFNKINVDILLKMGCEVHIAANFEQGSKETVEHNLKYRKQIEERGIIVHQIDFSRGSFIKNLSNIKMCRNLFLDEKFDMVHVHTETGGFITRLAMPKNTKTKFVYTPHGISFYKGSSAKSWILYYPVEKWMCKKMSVVLAMNNEEFEIVEKWIGKRSKYIHGVGLDNSIIQNAVCDRTQKRKELGIPENCTLILSSGELNKNKNHKVIIKALSEIKNNNVYYLICGEGQLRKSLFELSEKLELQDRVIFAGYRRDIPEILKIVDIFAFPSFHEGLPVSLMEAMSAELACVVSKIRGNVDLIENEKGGYLYEPKDIKGFTEGLRILINDSKKCEKMGSENKETVKKFDKETVYAETEKIYCEVLNNENQKKD